MRYNSLLKLCMVSIFFITSFAFGSSALALSDDATYDEEKYEIVKGSSNLHQESDEVKKNYATSKFPNSLISLGEVKLTDTETGETNLGLIENVEIEKLYDLVDKQTGEAAVHYKAEIMASTENQGSDNGVDKSGGLKYFQTIYYTATTNVVDYININKIDYRFERQDPQYVVTQKKMLINQRGAGINDNKYKDQFITVDLNSSGTILVRDFGWVATRFDHLITRLGTKTTALVTRGSNSWEFSFSMNPR
ncbi:hypothetical protein MHI01_13205 [Paenibacillus sp. FSL M7-0656]|uniref:hypothetical protein n=1 Tax=Paenibacillus sp. FSL M7-0656 TaxID=2921534 RepID=UPI0030F6BBDE